MDYYCWYKDANAVDDSYKTCIKMYSLKVGDTLGYKANDEQVVAKDYKYNLFNNMFMARGCLSGMAVIDEAAKTMKCV